MSDELKQIMAIEKTLDMLRDKKIDEETLQILYFHNVDFEILCSCTLKELTDPPLSIKFGPAKKLMQIVNEMSKNPFSEKHDKSVDYKQVVYQDVVHTLDSDSKKVVEKFTPLEFSEMTETLSQIKEFENTSFQITSTSLTITTDSIIIPRNSQ